MKFKLDNVTNLTAVRWAAAESFSFVSFNFDKDNAFYIEPGLVAEICKWVKGVKFIGLFNNMEPDEIISQYKLLNLDGIETNLSTAQNILQTCSIPCILQPDPHNLKACIEFKKQKGDVFAFSLRGNPALEDELLHKNCFIQSNNSPDRIKNEIFGINFDSEIETEPGILDFEKLESDKKKWLKWSYCR